MSEPQLIQLEMLARMDALTTRATEWSRRETAWQPLKESQALVGRTLSRVDALRVRLG